MKKISYCFLALLFAIKMNANPWKAIRESAQQSFATARTHLIPAIKIIGGLQLSTAGAIQGAEAIAQGYKGIKKTIAGTYENDYKEYLAALKQHQEEKAKHTDGGGVLGGIMLLAYTNKPRAPRAPSEYYKTAAAKTALSLSLLATGMYLFGNGINAIKK